MNTISVKADLRHLFGPVRDQGRRPTCLAFAVSDLHAALRGPWAPLSCEYVFYYAQMRANRPRNRGAILSAMLTTIREDGQPHENGWPYLANVPSDVLHWEPPSGVLTLFRRAGATSAYDLDAVIAELATGRPTILLLRLSTSFYRPGPDGLVDAAPGEVPDLHARHAVIAVGHGVIGTQRAVLIRNSWGDGWGSQGYGWVTEKFLVPRIFSLAILMEDLIVSPHSVAA